MLNLQLARRLTLIHDLFECDFDRFDLFECDLIWFASVSGTVLHISISTSTATKSSTKKPRTPTLASDNQDPKLLGTVASANALLPKTKANSAKAAAEAKNDKDAAAAAQPEVAPEPIPEPPTPEANAAAFSAYFQTQLFASLCPLLEQLAAERPQDPIKWLGQEMLIQHKQRKQQKQALHEQWEQEAAAKKKLEEDYSVQGRL